MCHTTSYLSGTGITPKPFSGPHGSGVIGAYPHIHCIDFFFFFFNSHATHKDVSTEPGSIAGLYFLIPRTKNIICGIHLTQYSHFQAGCPLISFRLSADKKNFEGEICVMSKTAKIRQIDCASKSIFLAFPCKEAEIFPSTLKISKLNGAECHCALFCAFFFSLFLFKYHQCYVFCSNPDVISHL